ncbi:MAG: hypothetical protein MHPSP_000072 [Paramarteilia canceri]
MSIADFQSNLLPNWYQFQMHSEIGMKSKEKNNGLNDSSRFQENSSDSKTLNKLNLKASNLKTASNRSSFKRRERTVFSESQLESLEKAFQEDSYPDYAKKNELAVKLNLAEARIQIWFKNRRAKLKRSYSEKGSKINYFNQNCRSNIPYLEYLSMQNRMPLNMYNNNDNKHNLMKMENQSSKYFLTYDQAFSGDNNSNPGNYNFINVGHTLGLTRGQMLKSPYLPSPNSILQENDQHNKMNNYPKGFINDLDEYAGQQYAANPNYNIQYAFENLANYQMDYNDNKFEKNPSNPIVDNNFNDNVPFYKDKQAEFNIYDTEPAFGSSYSPSVTQGEVVFPKNYYSNHNVQMNRDDRSIVDDVNSYNGQNMNNYHFRKDNLDLGPSYNEHLEQNDQPFRSNNEYNNYDETNINIIKQMKRNSGNRIENWNPYYERENSISNINNNDHRRMHGDEL